MPLRALIAALLLLLALPARAQDCFAPVDAAQLDAALGRAEAAWSAQDGDGFRAAVQEASAFLVPCLGERVTPEIAARLHRVLALKAFAAKQKDDAFAAMKAARVVAPDATLPKGLLPQGHELRLAYEAPPAEPERPVRLQPARGTLWFDGTATNLRPSRPTLAQIADPDGKLLVSRWLRATDPMPAYEVRPRLRPALIAVASVAAALGAGLAGGSGATYAAYHATDPSDAARLDALRATTNGLAGAAVGLGAVAIGIGVGAAVVGPR